MATVEQPHPLLPAVGSVFAAHYDVKRCLKAGGMGAVYEVVDLRTDRRRALKVLLPHLASDAETRARFELEARVTANLPGDHLVEVTDAGIDGESGAPFMVMELLRGRDLRDELAARGKLPVDEALSIARQVASALDVTHAVGIVHRDLKPENVFLCDDLHGSRVKLLDFGVAKLSVDGALSAATTRALGTPLYMAPEQLEGDGTIDGRADVFSLGHLVFTTLVGKAYLSCVHRDARILPLAIARSARRDPASRAAASVGVAVPPGFDPWFSKATASARDARFSTAGDAIDALDAALRGEATRSPRPRWLPALAVASLLCIGVLTQVPTKAPADAAPLAPVTSSPAASVTADPPPPSAPAVSSAASAASAPPAPSASTRAPPRPVRAPPPPSSPAGKAPARVADPTEIR